MGQNTDYDMTKLVLLKCKSVQKQHTIILLH